MEKKIVLVQGAFDITNAGHIKALRRCKSEGDYLIVALNSDRLLMEYKARKACIPYCQKKIILEGIRYVDKVVCCDKFSPLYLLKKFDVDVYCYTQEWEIAKEAELIYMREKGGRCVELPRYKNIMSTGKIKMALIEEAKTKVGFDDTAYINAYVDKHLASLKQS